MSTEGSVLRHPVNGTTEQTWDGFSWPAFFFGVFWLLVKGLYGHFVLMLIIVLASGGFAAPVVWIAYGFIGNSVHKDALLKKGYLTAEQWEKKEQPTTVVPTPVPPAQKDNLAQLRELADLREKGILTDEEFTREKSKILGV